MRTNKAAYTLVYMYVHKNSNKHFTKQLFHFTLFIFILNRNYAVLTGWSKFFLFSLSFSPTRRSIGENIIHYYLDWDWFGSTVNSHLLLTIRELLTVLYRQLAREPEHIIVEEGAAHAAPSGSYFILYKHYYPCNRSRYNSRVEANL